MTQAYPDQPILTIDLAALRGNWQLFRARCGPGTGATVKANGYGLGVERVAEALAAAGCETFFVATLSEAIELRAILPKETIYVFSGVDPQSAPILISNTIHPVLNTLDQVKNWAAARPPQGAAIHIDTGMSRLGFRSDELDALKADTGLLSAAGVTLAMTHLACADTPDHALNAQQESAFFTAAAAFPQLKTSISNSAGALNRASSDIARPGIGLYGGNPRPALDMPLKRVITLTAPILQRRQIKAGESIGYGSTFVAKADMQTATIGAGYADGVPRSIAEQGYAYIDGQRCKILGRVSMDSLVVNVTGHGGAKVGGAAELIGKTTVNDMAAWANTISYEILTGLGQRLKRTYINGEGHTQ